MDRTLSDSEYVSAGRGERWWTAGGESAAWIEKPAAGGVGEIPLQGLIRARLAAGTAGEENAAGAEKVVAARGWRRGEIVDCGQGSGELPIELRQCLAVRCGKWQL